MNDLMIAGFYLQAIKGFSALSGPQQAVIFAELTSWLRLMRLKAQESSSWQSRAKEGITTSRQQVKEGTGAWREAKPLR